MADGEAKTFSIIRKGYSPEEVDEYIDELEAKLSYYRTRNAELDQKLETARRLIKRFSASENELRQNIADSKRAAATMLSETKERCDTLLDETRESCGEIISDLDMRVTEKMKTVDIMKASVAAFKDELFNLYSSHIELIETLAASAEGFTYEPNYTPISDAVEAFEAQGEPDADAPTFEDYPDESIFEEVRTDEEQRKIFIMDETEAPAEQVAFDTEIRYETPEAESAVEGAFELEKSDLSTEGETGELEFDGEEDFEDIFNEIDEISKAQREAAEEEYRLSENDNESDAELSTYEPQENEIFSEQHTADEEDACDFNEEGVQEAEYEAEADGTAEEDEGGEGAQPDADGELEADEEEKPHTSVKDGDSRADEDYFKFLSDFANGDDGN